MRFRKKPVIVEAEQWFKNGDHSKDDCEFFKDFSAPPPHIIRGEGKLVRYYRTPQIDGQIKCDECGFIMHQHGWIDTREGGHIVCIGDWIITGVEGEHYPCKPSVFCKTYEPVDQQA